MKSYDTRCFGIRRSLSRFDLDGLARQSGWMSREGGKISPGDFASAMVGATSLGCASLRLVAFLAGTLAASSVSKQAIQKRLNAQARSFLERLLGEALSSKAALASPKRALGLRRVIAQDSTSIALPAQLLGSFRGCGHAAGQAAGLKVHASFDLLARRFTGFELREQRSPDQAFAAEGAEGLGEGDLMLRDLGYFSLASFRLIRGKGAHALSRWKPHLALLDPESMEPIALLPLLRSGAPVDREVAAGSLERLRMRLIAFPVPGDVAEKRRRKLRANMRRMGRTPSAEILELQGWQVYLTTCERELLSLEDAFEIYAQRWAIETLFKGLKSHLRVDRVPPRGSEPMVLCLIYAALIRAALATSVTVPKLGQPEGRPGTSLLKVFSLVEALGFEPDEDYFREAANLENFLRHCLYDKRKRKSLPQRLEALG